MKSIARALPLLALAGCGGSPETGLAEAKHRYLAAKAACDREYRDSLSLLADCRTHAANAYIRPYYRYGDLMTYAQDRRRALAAQADLHQISRRSYERQVAFAERQVSREEDRRNQIAHAASSYQSTPFTPVVATFARLFN